MELLSFALIASQLTLLCASRCGARYHASRLNAAPNAIATASSVPVASAGLRVTHRSSAAAANAAPTPHTNVSSLKRLPGYAAPPHQSHTEALTYVERA